MWLVKTKSPVDCLWVSFIEGLHRHAAITLALLCTKFDYENNLQPGSLSILDFKAAKIPHFDDPNISPEDQIKLIMNGTETSKILKDSFHVEVYIPNTTDGNILELMDSMRKQSQWISESKTRAANKTISTLLSIWLEDTLNHSKCSWRNNRYKRPNFTDMFEYQSPTSVSGDIFFFLNYEDWDLDESEPGANDSIYDYDGNLLITAWCEYTRDPFNKSTRGHWVEYITPEGYTNGQKKI